MIFKSVQALEDPIVEELFTQIIPDMPESEWHVAPAFEISDLFAIYMANNHFCTAALPSLP